MFCQVSGEGESRICCHVSLHTHEPYSSLTCTLLAVGTVPGPFDCYLMIRGIRTLHVRMKEHESNALAVAQFLEASSHVEETVYPGVISFISY